MKMSTCIFCSRPRLLTVFQLYIVFVSKVFFADSCSTSPSSLAFVFDTTGSMSNDLVQVQEGAKRIFETVLKDGGDLIHNYILVPFNDPGYHFLQLNKSYINGLGGIGMSQEGYGPTGVGPSVITRDKDFYLRKLKALNVKGGDDCPEMGVSGIKLALESALPSSFIYVFTDASSKDFHLTDEVLELIQLKQSVVVFVMTGDCGDRSGEGYRAYERISTASSGQMFHLDKTSVSTVLGFIKETLQVGKVNIASLDRDVGGSTDIVIPIDITLTEITISLTGAAPRITFIDEDESNGKLADLSACKEGKDRSDPNSNS